jgi:hypothetical protein
MAELVVPIFRVADVEVAAGWYERLGFRVEGVHRLAEDLPCYMYLRRGDAWLHRSEHAGDARPGRLVDVYVYVYVNDVDAIADEFDAEVTAQPWAREIELIDPDGSRLRIGTRSE